jgi:hypothetical protein
MFASPRLILFGMWVFTDYLTRAGVSWLWGFVGFLFVPCTTVAGSIAQNEFGGLYGWGMVVLAAGVILDIVIYYGERVRRRSDRASTRTERERRSESRAARARRGCHGDGSD